MIRLCLALVFVVLGCAIAQAQDGAATADLDFLVGEFEGVGKHPWGEYEETQTSTWTLGDTTLELRSTSKMGPQTVFEDLRVFTVDAEAGVLRMRQFTAGLLREYTGTKSDTGELVFTETSHEGKSDEEWRYTFTPTAGGGFSYRVETRPDDGGAEWNTYVTGDLTERLQDPGKGGGLAMRQYDTTIDGMRAEVHHPDGAGPFPSIVFSPGGNAATAQGYAPYGRWYATWGYITVIVAFDDADAAERAPKFSNVADWLIAENGRDGSPLEGLVDTEKLAAAGHSRGGNAALRAARADARFTACLAFAPSGPKEAVDGPGKASVCIIAAEKDDLLPAAKAAYETASGERYLLEIEGMGHMLGPREATLKLVARSTSFLNHALQGDARYRKPLVAAGAGITVTTAGD